jgi:hypothetical protein
MNNTEHQLASHFLQKCEMHKLNNEQMLNLAIRFLVCVITAVYDTSSFNRKRVINLIDLRLKDIFRINKAEKL